MRPFNILALFSFFVVSVFCAPATAGISPEREAIVDWAFTRISTWSPPGRLKGTTYPDAVESADEAINRYRSIASDAVDVAYDPNESPIFSGRDGRAKTLALILATASSESAFRRDVDFGLGKYSKGDNGRSWCLSQINLGQLNKSGRTGTRIVFDGMKYSFTNDPNVGFGGEDMVRDRKICFRAAVRIIRSSFGQCRHLPMEDRLAIYTSGDCDKGHASSRIRVGKAVTWVTRHAPPLVDSVVMESIMNHEDVGEEPIPVYNNEQHPVSMN